MIRRLDAPAVVAAAGNKPKKSRSLSAASIRAIPALASPE
jgi:hypothetical protein